MPSEINHAPQAPETSSPSLVNRRGSVSKPNHGAIQVIAIVIVAIIVIVSWMWASQNKLSGFDKDWQAVFLTNGQVYFGQVKAQNSAQVILKDIYYLQVTRPLQQTQEGQEQADATQGELSLVKLGNELHGPTDNMYINRDHVLFIEDLKDDSNVVQAIDNYKTGQ
ncbi:MAG: hypothetical protein CO042_02490 [Parcubacteria group bacterium CG_4_9_14_0_2_um_filter_41_8]|nr:MAG: hypothetical protein AUJ34_00840 [Parcubacteria group bacterium CG1_02_41_12]PIP67239.1 MAG: hypothetical protein COW93_01175 [Parcubacteria group bacterium CG22_combo_CG10-13_8_21_14_all_41_9]PIQ80176.1 MAG: hypothetical protein COV79_01805 [Parcubacteria group bacterium CG11_big_fil_rev_8_21_14_0_20_41_14]PIR56809.1 MAG: hypothetical protein COU72_04225 [Parcubacteria group bacterium CG10_big_fil_rev_8_21_14_0_10_41_35]PIZ80341.1 MAG: hypothetical protein COY02_03585 [Parcubacteria gr